MSVHIGKIILKVVEDNHISKISLSKKINVSPQNLQSIFSRSSIDSELLFRISKALNHSFFNYYNLNLKNEKLENEREKLEEQIKLLILENTYLKKINDLLEPKVKKK